MAMAKLIMGILLCTYVMSVAGDFWLQFSEKFEEISTTGDDEIVDVLSYEANGTHSGEVRKRATDVCGEYGGNIFVDPQSDGDSCCGTKRAPCVWFFSFTKAGKEYFPVWKATVNANLKLKISYQYWEDIRCVEKSCSHCDKFSTTRYVFATTTAPVPLEKGVPGRYGHIDLGIKDATILPYEEDSYCMCIN